MAGHQGIRATAGGDREGITGCGFRRCAWFDRWAL